MSFREIQFNCFNEIIVPALDWFYSEPRDQDLIARNASERAIVANIYSKVNTSFTQKKEAIQELDDLVIDIEYNRNGENSKEVFGKCDFCNKKDCFIKQRHFQYTTSLPDMIIHHRGFNDNNQVIFEYKKVSNRNNKDREDDKAKLIYFTCQQPFQDHENENYQYRIGFFIDLDLTTYSITTYQNANYGAPRIRQGGVWL
jgi:hypothetical protein